jgi:hypothetical protein
VKKPKKSSPEARIAAALERLAEAQHTQARMLERMMAFWDEVAPLMLRAAKRDLEREEKRDASEDE